MTEDKQNPLTIDWLLFAARWPVLIVVFIIAVFLRTPGSDLRAIYLALALGVGYNLFVLLLLAFKFYPQSAALAAHAVDVALLLVFFYISGAGRSPLFVLAVLPVIIAPHRFDQTIGFATALALSFGYGLMIILSFGQAPPLAVLVPYGLIVFVLLLLAGLLPEMMKSRPATARGRGADSATEIARLREELDRLQMVYNLASTLTATLSYERVLDALLDISVMGLQELDGSGFRSPRMVLLFSSKDRLKVVTSRHVQEQDRNRTIAGQAGLLQEALLSAEPVIGESASLDAELKEFVSLSNVQSMLCVPLRAGFETYGLVLFTSPQPRAYTAEHIELLSTFCNQAVIALQNARLYQRLQEEKQHIIETQEDANRRLARELHDGPTQSISAIAMRLNFTKLLVNREPEKAAAELDKLEDLARRTAKEIRTMLFTLRPVVLETQGLTAALKQYADKLKEVEGLTVHVQSTLDERLPARIEDVAFSVIEEAVNNARKHAKADDVFVRLKLQQDLFVAEVEDDGRGFDVSSVEKGYDQRGSLGLINMKERAALVDGTLSIDSAPGKGTTVTLIIPLSETYLA